MKYIYRYVSLAFASILILFMFQNCGQPGSIANTIPTLENPTSTPPTPEPPIDNPSDVFAVKLLPSSKFICEPFGNMNGGDVKGGLKAELRYVDPTLGLSATQKNAYGVLTYFSDQSEFIKTSTPLFLSQVNVPTRLFDQGFGLSDGTVLKDTQGNKLIEWFALKMKSLLKLSATDLEGEYEIASISDDGSRVFLGAPDSNGVQPEIINNDGAHSTRMKCAAQPVSLNKTSKIPLTYYYNQGPRTEIANVLVWRKVAVASNAGYKHCGVTSRTSFWNPTDSSEGTLWRDLVADGWKVIDANNFELPDSQINPCATQNNNLITKAEFSPLTAHAGGLSTTLNIDFAMAANIKAKLFKIVMNQPVLVQSFDFSAQAKDKISLDIVALEKGATYSVEVLLEMPANGNQVLNEVKFEILKL